jgi:hypothetical protein
VRGSDAIVTTAVFARLTAAPNTLWPPNHKMEPVTLTTVVSGICAASTSCRITSVTSNEPINGPGDGNTDPDWVITGPLTLQLRAERSGNNRSGRIYTITVECRDSFGNVSRKDVTVIVPHDQR